MASRLLNDFQVDSGLSQPAAESMSEIVPSKVLNLSVLDRFEPPSSVLNDVEHSIAPCHSPEFHHGSKGIIVHVNGPGRSIFCVVRHDPSRDKINIGPEETVLLPLPHPGIKGNCEFR
jgi:hypothetical protein